MNLGSKIALFSKYGTFMSRAKMLCIVIIRGYYIGFFSPSHPPLDKVVWQ